MTEFNMQPFEVQSVGGITLRGAVLAAPKTPHAVISLVHGFGEHCGRYRAMADYLAMQGMAVVGIDLRGHGHSDGKRGVCHDYADMHADLDALLIETRKRFPDIPHILYGHSMGGGLVMHYVLRHAPDDLQAIISSAPLLRPADPVPKPLEWLVRLLRKFVPNFALDNGIDGAKISNLPHEQSQYENDPLNHGRLGVGLAVGIVEAGEEVLARASEWALPLLLLHSRDDQLTDFASSEVFAAQVPSCEFHAYAGVQHELHNDATRKEVYAVMRDYIQAQVNASHVDASKGKTT